MSRSKFSWQAGVASGALLAGAVIGVPQCFGAIATPPAPAEAYAFQFANRTSASQSSLSLVLSGDQSTSLSSGTYENSFATTTSYTTTFANDSTTITFSGSPVASNGTATVGFDWSGLAAPDITGAYWGSVATSNAISPLPLTASPPGIVADPWADITYDVSGTQYWFEEQFAPGTNPSINITNTNSNTETLLDAGYFISESYIPLDQLNFGYQPPPDISGSPFTPLPSMDGQTLPGGGGNINFTIPLPIPSPLALAGIGAIGLLAARQLRKRRRGDAI